MSKEDSEGVEKEALGSSKDGEANGRGEELLSEGIEH
jgi:hypothetical protein